MSHFCNAFAHSSVHVQARAATGTFRHRGHSHGHTGKGGAATDLLLRVGFEVVVQHVATAHVQVSTHVEPRQDTADGEVGQRRVGVR